MAHKSVCGTIMVFGTLQLLHHAGPQECLWYNNGVWYRTGATSRWARPWAWAAAGPPLVRRGPARRRPSRIWARHSASTSLSSTARIKWITGDSGASIKVSNKSWLIKAMKIFSRLMQKFAVFNCLLKYPDHYYSKIINSFIIYWSAVYYWCSADHFAVKNSRECVNLPLISIHLPVLPPLPSGWVKFDGSCCTMVARSDR